MPASLDEFAEPFAPLDEVAARDALAGRWGLAPTALTRLDTERDDTFRAETSAGAVILKIAHPNDDPQVIAMQSAALAHVHATDPGIPVPQVIPARDGAASAEVEGRVARVLTWLEGDLVDDSAMSPALFEDAGRMLGRLNRALSGFRHPGADRVLAWDLPHLPDLRGYATDALHLEVIDRFAAEVVPALAQLPHQVIHNDGHPGNLLVRDGRISGILDFGDAVLSARICDLAVALTYLVPDAPRPWPDVDAFAAGFESEVPLLDGERAVLPMLMAARTIMRTVVNQQLARDAHSDPHGFYALNDRRLRMILETP
jgi:hydroxylysine kinase